MKRITTALMILTLLVAPAVAQEDDEESKGEEVVIDTPYEEEVTLTIPEDYETLREYYIELAELYQEAKYDLDQELEATEALLANQERLLQYREEDRELLREVREDISKPTLPEFLNHGPLVGVGTSYNAPYTIHAGYQITILRSFKLQVQAQYPFGAAVMVGWEF